MIATDRHWGSRPPAKPQGFALVVTLSLMVLLTVVAVGLLSLATISLRSSSHGLAEGMARSNARMALTLALGELQKSMGPDKAISATSEILDAEPAKPNLTGVWESWDFNPASPEIDYAVEKNRRFRRWLVSDSNVAATADLNYASAPFVGDTVELVGKASLGGLDDDSLKVKAGRVAIVHHGKVTGNYAWHVADESVKARINSYRDHSRNRTLAEKRALLTGHRPDSSVVTASDQTRLDFLPSDDGAANLATALAASGKLIDLNQADLLADSRRIGKFRNIVTPYSLGLMTNVRRGGLKEDLTSMFESASLPPKYRGMGLYGSTHGISGVSDPNWSALAGYYNLYKKITTPDTNPNYYGSPAEPLDLAESQVAPHGFYPGPVIAKVEVLFTFVTRDAHWSSPGTPRMGHLVYSPLVTLHNPYNISISFDKMQVVIRNMPVAFNFIVNDKPQLVDLAPLCELYLDNGRIDNRGEKSFAIDIGNWNSADPADASIAGPIVLKPGQTLVSGPFLDPNASWTNNSSFVDWMNDGSQTGVDRSGNVIGMMKGKPGFLGKAVGFDIDYLTPVALSTPIEDSSDRGVAVLGLKPTDTVAIEFGIRQPTFGIKDRFQVSASIVQDGKTIKYGGLDFVYGDAATLRKYFKKTYRFPQKGGFAADSAYHSNRVPLKDQGNAKAFALFSAYARTTRGGVYETDSRTEVLGALNVLRDGRLVGKPYLDHNPASPVVTMNLKKNVPGMHSYELNMVYLPGHAEDVFEIDAENRNSMVTGNTTSRGLKSGTYLELATGPMITIADFRRSNALTTSFLPNTVQPVSNSRASPLIATGHMIETGVADYELLDHSVLANHALYDNFYFSTLVSPVPETPTDEVLKDFLEAKSLVMCQAFQPYLPEGQTVETACAELLAAGKPGDKAFQLAAEYQMVKGAFNVNSTSVEAWKAVLSSLNKSGIPILWPRNLELGLETPYGVPILPMSLVNGGRTANPAVDIKQIDNVRTNQWNGYRELSAGQVAELAKRIVEQVRARGPFQSLSEFVNRRIGKNSELTRAGALHTAIEKAKINSAVFAAEIPVTAADLADAQIYRYQTMENAVGNPAEGAPGWVTQGDIMRVIEPLATVRADTFVIRAYGDATGANGKVISRACVEAVVQRVPEYVNPVVRPSVNVYETDGATSLNAIFGRRIKIVSFRWLSNLEL